MEPLRSLDLLDQVMPKCSISVVRTNVENWELSPEAIDALVALFLSIDSPTISVDDILQMWKNHGLGSWTVADRTFSYQERMNEALKVYCELRRSSASA